jgi:homoserine dehydrogenase
MDHSSDSLADALARAQEAGYAEKDPFDDLAGLDVRSKVVLSCAEAFDEIPALSSVPVFGLQHLSRQDLAYAQEKGGRIKLLGRGKKSDCGIEASVLPVLVSLENPFAHVARNLNRVECTSAALGTLALEGQGAGSLPTAHAMVEDALCLQEGRYLPAGKKHLCQAAPSSDKHRYYLRSSRLPENPAGKRVGPDALVSEPMDMPALLELVGRLEDPEVFVMEADDD